MSEKPISPGLKLALEFGPVILFFIAYQRMRDDTYMVAGTEYSGFIVATVLFIPLLLASIATLWKLTGQLSRMQLLTAFMVIFFGGLTVWFNDERFFKMKTTLVYGLFAAVLGTGLLLGKSWLAYVMDGLMPLKQEGWMILTRRLTGLFAVLAVGNEIVWRTMSTDAWVKIETFGFPVLIFVFLMAQAKMFERYSTEPKDKA